jgi:hypothetical protein
MIHKVAHKFQSEIFVPWCAISGNIDLMQDKAASVETSDGVSCSASSRKEIHILSKEASDLAQNLYGISVMQLMRRWYQLVPRMSEMWFVYLKLEKIKEDVTETDEPSIKPTITD